MFNTAFIQRGNYIKAGKMELSPEDIRKDKNKQIPADFIVYIFFEDFCSICNPYETEIEDLCDRCKNEIGEATLKEWIDVKKIMSEHDFPAEETARRLLPNVDPELMRTTLETPLQFNPNYYRIYTPEEILALDENREEEIKQKVVVTGRRASQFPLNFPVRPDQINNDLLSPMNAVATDDIDARMNAELEAIDEGNEESKLPSFGN